MIWIGCAGGHARGRPGRSLVPASVASPRLGDELFARLLACGTPHETGRGDVLFRPGDQDVDLIVAGRGSVEVVRTGIAGVPAATVAAVDAGGFAGKLNLRPRLAKSGVGQRSSRLRSATCQHIVIGSNNFRSPIISFGDHVNCFAACAQISYSVRLRWTGPEESFPVQNGGTRAFSTDTFA